MKAEGTDVRAGKHSDRNTAWEGKKKHEAGRLWPDTSSGLWSKSRRKSRFLIRDNNRKLKKQGLVYPFLKLRAVPHERQDGWRRDIVFSMLPLIYGR